MTARPTIASPLYPVISAYGSGGAANGVNTSNLVRYAVGQPQLVDPGGYIADWSYDEDTGTLQVEYNAIAAPLGAASAPHFQWTLYGLDGTSVSTVDPSGDAHFYVLPLVTDINYSGGVSDRPSVAVGLSNTLGSVNQGVNAIWSKTSGSGAGASCSYYTAGVFEFKSNLDNAPGANCIGSILTYEPRGIYNTNATTVMYPRASSILPTGDYDSGQEAIFTTAIQYFNSTRYLDVWLGAAEWNGGSGAVPAGETISMTVAAITLPFFPRFLGSNFIKQP